MLSKGDHCEDFHTYCTAMIGIMSADYIKPLVAFLVNFMAASTASLPLRQNK